MYDYNELNTELSVHMIILLDIAWPPLWLEKYGPNLIHSNLFLLGKGCKCLTFNDIIHNPKVRYTQIEVNDFAGIQLLQ